MEEKRVEKGEEEEDEKGEKGRRRRRGGEGGGGGGREKGEEEGEEKSPVNICMLHTMRFAQPPSQGIHVRYMYVPPPLVMPPPLM